MGSIVYKIPKMDKIKCLGCGGVMEYRDYGALKTDNFSRNGYYCTSCRIMELDIAYSNWEQLEDSQEYRRIQS